MRKLIFFVFILVLTFFSCTNTKERETVIQTIEFKNSTNQILNITGYDNLNELVIHYQLNPNDSNYDCSYLAENFLGFSCEADSLVFQFQNEGGYICALRSNGTQFCFQDKSPYEQGDFHALGNNTYEFVINQEDFENAYELTE